MKTTRKRIIIIVLIVIVAFRFTWESTVWYVARCEITNWEQKVNDLVSTDMTLDLKPA